MNIPDTISVRSDHGMLTAAVPGNPEPGAHWGNDHIRVVPYRAESFNVAFGQRLVPVPQRGMERHLTQHCETTINQVCREGQSGPPSDVLNHTSSSVKKIPWQSQLYKCCDCSQSFSNQVLLVKHYESHEHFQCQQCHASFDTIVTQENHLCTNANNEFFKCEFCSLPFPNLHALRCHHRIHKDNRPFRCTECPKSFRTRWLLSVHARVHDDKHIFACSICHQRFRSAVALRRHVLKHSAKNFAHECPECQKCFRSPASLEEHMRSHTGEKPYRCSLCPMTFALTRNLTQHMKSHGGADAFKCPQCGVRFRHKARLTVHFREHHS